MSFSTIFVEDAFDTRCNFITKINNLDKNKRNTAISTVQDASDTISNKYLIFLPIFFVVIVWLGFFSLISLTLASTSRSAADKRFEAFFVFSS